MLDDITAQTRFRTWTNPKPGTLGRSVTEFLQTLAGPAHIHVHGKQRNRCRVVVTLLHGNEPSGVGAVFHMLERSVVPAVDVHFFIPNIAAALAPPGFHYRMLPGRRDLNRCFKPPYTDAEGNIARALLDTIAELRPEAAIDIHNTSGEGPAFAVTTHMDQRHDALAALFSHRMVVTNLRLGALMEISERLCPTVTVECGGARSEAAHHTAISGLQKYLTQADVLTPGPFELPLDFYHNPIRLEFLDKASARLAYQKSPAIDGGLTLRPDIEKYNFNVITPDDCLGFIDEDSLQNLSARTARGEDKVQHYFISHEGRLHTTMALKLFMITTNADIARDDCLFYFVEVP